MSSRSLVRVNSSYSAGPPHFPGGPPLPWAPLAMTFSLSQWVGGGVDGNEQRERPRRGWGGGLDESQGIPAPAACTRGPELPFLRLLCKPKPVSFEMAPGSHRPPMPTPCPVSPSPASPHRCLGKRREFRKNPGAFKGAGVGIHALYTA